jgi:hypothetical protein
MLVQGVSRFDNALLASCLRAACDLHAMYAVAIILYQRGLKVTAH